MSTDLVTTNVQLPAHLASRVGAASSVAGSMTAGIGGTSFKRISIRGSRFRIREGTNETVLPSNILRTVIVGASDHVSKLFYKKYDAKVEDKKPDCYSNDGIRPANDAADPQAQLCATCEQNQWGSKVSDDSGSKMKACADQKRLAVISADDDSPEPEVYMFTVTPSSLTDFRNYGKLLASKGFPPEICITELSFDTSVSHPKVQFKFGGFVEEHMVPIIDGIVDSAIVNEITGKVSQVATIIEPPKNTKPSPVRAKKSEPEVEEVEVEVIPAPTKVKGFGAATPVKATVVATPPTQPPVVQSSKLTDDIQDILNSMQEEDDE